MIDIFEPRKISGVWKVAAIAHAHRAAGYQPASLREEPPHSTWRGIRRVHGTAQNGKVPLWTEELRQMLVRLPHTLLGVRNRALLLLALAGGMRRNEVVGLDVPDFTLKRDGLVVTIRRSNTDQTGEGRVLGVPVGSRGETCPVRAVQDWLTESGLTVGTLFRYVDRHGNVGSQRLSGYGVALTVQRCAAAAGLVGDYAGHSLRAGLATSAMASSVAERVIAKQTGHRSLANLLRYIRNDEFLRENAAASLGL